MERAWLGTLKFNCNWRPNELPENFNESLKRERSKSRGGREFHSQGSLSLASSIGFRYIRSEYVVNQDLLLEKFTYDRMEIKVLGLPCSLRQ